MLVWIFLLFCLIEFSFVSPQLFPLQGLSPPSPLFSAHPYRSYKHFWQAPAADTMSSWASSAFRKAPRAQVTPVLVLWSLKSVFRKTSLFINSTALSKTHVRHGGLQSYAVVTAEDKKPCLGLQSLFCWVSIAKQDFAVALKRVISRFLLHVPQKLPWALSRPALQTPSSHNLSTSNLFAISIIFLSALSLLY